MPGGQPKNVREVVLRLRSAAPEDLAELLERYDQDPRAGIKSACAAARKRLAAYMKIVEHTQEMYAAMHEFGGKGVVIGVDEVGRGPIAGPLTVAAVALPDEPLIVGLDDSKKLKPEQREELARAIRKHALGIGIAHIPPEDIDACGMSASLHVAMLRAVKECGIEHDAVLIDGNPMHLGLDEVNIVKGDGKVACIAAASIVAKVTRDHLMGELEKESPGYGFAQNKGYASEEHIQAVRTLGLTPVHRATFCEGILNEQTSLF